MLRRKSVVSGRQEKENGQKEHPVCEKLTGRIELVQTNMIYCRFSLTPQTHNTLRKSN